MKGFEIIYNKRPINIEIKEDALLMIFFNTRESKDKKEHSSFQICNVEYTEQTRNRWVDTSINLGDEFDIKFGDLEYSDPPLTSNKDNNIVRAGVKSISKIEEFYLLESELKEKGLL